MILALTNARARRVVPAPTRASGSRRDTAPRSDESSARPPLRRRNCAAGPGRTWAQPPPDTEHISSSMARAPPNVARPRRGSLSCCVAREGSSISAGAAIARARCGRLARLPADPNWPSPRLTAAGSGAPQVHRRVSPRTREYNLTHYSTGAAPCAGQLTPAFDCTCANCPAISAVGAKARQILPGKTSLTGY